jgi:UDP-sulfoquinovose synthase
VELAAEHPAAEGEFRVFNQFTEQFSVIELAAIVQRAGREHGLEIVVDHLDNPRVEMEEHYYNARHSKLLDLGLEPHLLSETLLEHVFDVIARYRDRVVEDHILPRTRWRPPTREKQATS